MKKNNKDGFSLVELLVYIGIFAASATFLVSVMVIFTRIHVRQTSVNEVNSQISFVNNLIQNRVKDSSLIEMGPGVSTSTLTLRMSSSTLDPTLIYWDSDQEVVLLKEGSADPKPLTNSNVNVKNFSVTKYENPGGHDVAQINLTIDYDTQNIQAKYQRSVNTAISRVSAATFDSDGLPNADDTFDLGSTSYRWQDLYLSGSAYVDDNVGIGTTTPLRALTVTDSAIVQALFNGINATGALIDIEGATDSSYIGTRINENGSTRAFFGYYPGTDNIVISSSQGGNELLSISGGNVGIGTSTPSNLLHVMGGITIASSTPNSTSSALYNQGDTLYWNGTELGGGFWTQSGSDIYYTDGGVSIGTTTARDVLHLSSTGDTALTFTNGDSNVGQVRYDFGTDGFEFRTAGDQIADTRFFIGDDGFVGIGATTAISGGELLSVNGMIWAENGVYTGYELRFAQDNLASETLCVSDASVNRIRLCSSSIKLKKNVEDMKLGGLSTIMNLRPVEFDWKEDNRHDIGFIAEEVYEVDPILNTFHDDGSVRGVKYMYLTSVLTKAMQEQQEIIESQKEDIELIKKETCEKDPTYSWCN